MGAAEDGLAKLQAVVGKEGVGEWHTVDQKQINLFADATLDHQFIHIDPEKSAQLSPYKVTIAHGFLTLTDDSEVIYLVDEFYSPENERVVRYDDPRFRIEWPAEVRVISDKDRTARDFDPAYHLSR